MKEMFMYDDRSSKHPHILYLLAFFDIIKNISFHVDLMVMSPYH